MDKQEINKVMLESELSDVRRANTHLGEVLREIYRLNGEDKKIAELCNDAFKWINI